MLELRNVVKRFGSLEAVRDVNLSIQQGEFFSLLGPSGCGKTTLLRLLAGFDDLTTGEMIFNDRRIDLLPANERHFNMVFQRYALFPHLNVWENVAFGLRVKKVAREELNYRVEEALALVQLTDLSRRSIATLSGGQQQRVALARALVNRPSVLLLDEPLSALDLKLRQQMQVELLQLQRKVKMTFIFVTHDQEEALTLSDRIAVMNEGRIEQIGTPQEIYEYPKTEFVARFIGSINTVHGCVQEVSPEKIVIGADFQRPVTVKPSRDGQRGLPPLSVGASVGFLVRPEKLKVLKSHPGPDQNFIEGVLKEMLYQGFMTQFYVQFKAPKENVLQVTQINSAMSAKKNFVLGERVYVSWAPEDVHILENGEVARAAQTTAEEPAKQLALEFLKAGGQCA